MPTPENKAGGNALLVCVQNDSAFVRVIGRGGFNVAPALRDFGAYVCRHETLRRMVVDMLACTSMDSTFMGVLAGLSHRFATQRQGQVLMVNMNPHTFGLLATLGLDRILQAYRMAEEPPEITRLLEQVQPRHALDTSSGGEQTRATMVAAHESLVQLVPENEEAFRDVLEFLKKEAPVQRERPAPARPEDAS